MMYKVELIHGWPSINIGLWLYRPHHYYHHDTWTLGQH